MKIKLGQLRKVIKEVLEEGLTPNGVDIIGTNPLDLKRRNPTAYEALPEEYKADSVLEFYYDINGDLYATHDMGEEFWWTGQRWVSSDTGMYYEATSYGPGDPQTWGGRKPYADEEEGPWEIECPECYWYGNKDMLKAIEVGDQGDEALVCPQCGETIEEIPFEDIGRH